jgi:hypothetical protein
VNVLARVCVEDHLLEEGHDLAVNLGDEDDEATAEASLVIPDQGLPDVPLGVLGVEERRPLGDRGQ